MRKLVGRNVRWVREQRELTQEALAEKVGFSQQYLSDLENGKRNPTIITLYEIAKALGASVEDLIRAGKK